MVQQHRGMLKLWSAALIAATFVLCIFGTYLTRSGVVSSVHAFGESLVGTFFLVFLLVAIFSSTLLLVIRQKVLRTEHAIENLLGKEALFLASNVLLVGMTVVTLVGTIFPIISRTLGGREVTVGPAFYNKVVAPLALLLTALMAVGPLLTYGAEASKKLLRGLVIPGLAAVVTPVVFWRCGLHNGWASGRRCDCRAGDLGRRRSICCAASRRARDRMARTIWPRRFSYSTPITAATVDKSCTWASY